MWIFSRVESIDPERAAELVGSGEGALLDVRQEVEWKQGHARGALHIPLAHLRQRARELPAEKTIITACRSGHRSALAARTLRRAGYQVENLRGGMKAWAKAGLPLDPAQGKIL